MSFRYHGRHRPAALIPLPSARAIAALSAAAAVGVLAPATASASTVAAAPAVAPPAQALAASTPQVINPALGSFRGLIRKGDRGALVKTVQRKVGVSADGAFGPITERGVKRYQRAKGLAADGIVGPRTASTMGLRGTSPRSSRTSQRPSVGNTNGVIATAARYVGTPYVYGGASPSGFDCSGFTSYVFRQNGISLPRTAEQQRQATDRVSSPQVGDLVFFGAPAYHVGIYAGNGQIYDAGRSGSTVSKRSIWTSAVSYGRA